MTILCLLKSKVVYKLMTYDTKFIVLQKDIYNIQYKTWLFYFRQRVKDQIEKDKRDRAAKVSRTFLF